MADIQPQNAQIGKDNKIALLRFFSVDNTDGIPNLNATPELNYNFYSKAFFLKIAQLLIGIVCAGLYSEAVPIMMDTVTSLTFPNVVFGSLIMITSVIVLSYVLGHVMPDILVRAFNALGMVLYFVSATVTLVVWLTKPVYNQKLVISKQYLLAQTILSYLNCILYGCDMILSVKRAIIFEI